MWMAGLLSAALAAAPIAHMVAQDQPVSTGARVRVSAPQVSPRDPLIGSVIALVGDTMVLRIEQPPDWASETASIPYRSITRLEVSRGRKSAIRSGLFVGMGVGGLAGTALGATNWTQCKNDRDVGTGGCIFFEGLCVAGGGLVGALIGAVVRSDRWEQVPVDRVRVGLAPRPGGVVTLGVTIRF